MANNNNTTIINAQVLIDGCKLCQPYGYEHIRMRKISGLIGKIITGENIAEAIRSGIYTGLRVSPRKVIDVMESFTPEEWNERQEFYKTLLVKNVAALNSLFREVFVAAFERLDRLEKCMSYAKNGEYEMTEVEKKELARLKELLDNYDSYKRVNLLSKKISVNDVDELIDELLEISVLNK